MNSFSLYVYTTFSLSLSFSGHQVVVTSWLLWIVLQKTWLYKYVFKILLLVSFYCVLRTETAGSYGNSVFHCLNNLRTIFCSGCTILPFQQQCTKVTHSLYTYHTLLSVVVGFFFCLFLFLFFFFLIGALLTDVRWYVMVFNVIDLWLQWAFVAECCFL